MRKTNPLHMFALAMCVFCAKPSAAQRHMENLDRGVVAINEGVDGVFVSWRLLGNEAADLGFDVLRHSGDHAPVRLNTQPHVGPTHFQDRGADLSLPTRYSVRPLGDANELEGSFTLPASPPVQRYLAVPLRTPDGYRAGDTSVGDLDGDGQYEFVVHMVGQGRDNSQSGITTEPILHAYKQDGTFLWSVNLGKNIREGAHYTQFMVYDLDCDGKAEMVCKTADGTVDGTGTVVGDASVDHRQLAPENSSRRRARGVGYILKGPEYLTVFNGETGAAMATVVYVPQRHPDTNSPTPDQMRAVWGDDYGNRLDRFLACVAYLDGESPSVVMSRGYYTRTVLAHGTGELENCDDDFEKIYLYPNSHAGYYPGARPIAMKVIFRKSDGRLLGAQALGEDGVDKRISTLAMAIQMGANIYDLEEAELCYAPQFGSAKDPVNFAGMVAADVLRGDMPLAHWDSVGNAFLLDVREPLELAVEKVPGAVNIPLGELRARIDELPRDREILVVCRSGQRAYYAMRMLLQKGFKARNLAGGMLSRVHTSFFLHDETEPTPN